MIDRNIVESYVPPAMIAVASGFLAMWQEHQMAMIGYTISAGWLVIGISREVRMWRRGG